ncbi:hypothetical protein GA0070622_1171 [Micromonospora sediminicola]|uniref:Uncharacterized protein n=1 Tax=Micromonospora sediminicola TaxID=946078 RepID=A0A1A9B563_9ACTN|nr:hypothetical protein [Micromonospora sediminicola]SBT64201.1 hypothetical protein GA0070622_1171 [Micromonospora sediminicola]
MASIRSLLRRLTSRPDPAISDRGQRIQRNEHDSARQRVLELGRQRQAEYRYERRDR